MWQTISKIDFLHSSHVWIQSILLRGKHSTTMQIRIVPRFWFCGRPWRFKMNIRWTLMHFRKTNICANNLDVQQTDISLAQLNRSWTYFSGCRFTHGRNFCAWSVGLSNWSISFLTEPNQQIQRSGSTHHTPHEKPKFYQARQSGSE